MKKDQIKRPIWLKILVLIAKIPFFVFMAGLNTKSQKRDEAMEFLMQNPKFLDPRPPKDIPPNER